MIVGGVLALSLATLALADPDGEALLADLRCTACHAADDATRARLRSTDGPRLTDAGARLAPRWLEHFLTDHGAARDPARRQPDLLAALPEKQRASARRELLATLTSLDGPFEPTGTREADWRIEAGGLLFDRVGCRACHPDALANRDLASKTDLPHLAALLRDPRALWPSGEMPSLALTPRETLALAAWLLREQHAAGPAREVRLPGLEVSVFEFEHDPVDEADWIGGEPVYSTVTERVDLSMVERADRFGVVFSGDLKTNEPGRRRLYTESDDGSMLRIDGELVVDNDGQHSMQPRSAHVRLQSRHHALELTMFELTGDAGLEAGYTNAQDQRTPFAPEELSHVRPVYEPLGHARSRAAPKLIERGLARLSELRCNACHTDLPATPHDTAANTAPALVDLRRLDAGCLSDNVPAGAPDYGLSEAQTAELRAVLARPEQLSRPLTAADSVRRTMRRLKCTACHARDGAGGPDDRVRPFFTTDVDLGDEGRLPPDLTHVGSRLRPEWLRRVLVGDERVRGYMHVRMPSFGEAAVGHLVHDFDAADEIEGERSAPAFDPELVPIGRELVGTGGFSCITCHEIAGRPSLGEPAVDLAHTHERLTWSWFRRWIEDPVGWRPGTRMPGYFGEGESVVSGVLDGRAAPQIEAVWHYLSLGDALPLPPGLVVDPNSYTLAPVERAVWCGVFMDGLSARVTAVGLPENVHIAFDQHHVRLAKAWKGAFLDAQGTWYGRAGQLEVPAGTDLLDLPEGAAFAWMADVENTPWPEAHGKPAGWRMSGHRRDPIGLPTFLYRQGALAVEESLRAGFSAGGGTLTRSFVVNRGAETDSGIALVLRAARSSSIQTLPPPPTNQPLHDVHAFAFVCANGLTLRVRGAHAQVRHVHEADELLVIAPADGHLFTVEMMW